MKLTTETDGPIAEQAAMRLCGSQVRYSKGEVDGRDRWTDDRAGGYAVVK